MNSEAIVALIAATFGGIGTVITQWIRSWFKGRMHETQKKQLELDREVTRRRAAEQALHAHRVALINALPPGAELPRMPGDD